MDRVSYGERGRREHTRDFFRIQILCSITRDVFGEAVRLEALLNGLEDDLFEGAGRVLAELSRVGMVAVWHRVRRWRRHGEGGNDESRTGLDPLGLVLAQPERGVWAWLDQAGEGTGASPGRFNRASNHIRGGAGRGERRQTTRTPSAPLPSPQS